MNGVEPMGNPILIRGFFVTERGLCTFIKPQRTLCYVIADPLYWGELRSEVYRQ